MPPDRLSQRILRWSNPILRGRAYFSVRGTKFSVCSWVFSVRSQLFASRSSPFRRETWRRTVRSGKPSAWFELLSVCFEGRRRVPFNRVDWSCNRSSARSDRKVCSNGFDGWMNLFEGVQNDRSVAESNRTVCMCNRCACFCNRQAARTNRYAPRCCMVAGTSESRNAVPSFSGRKNIPSSRQTSTVADDDDARALLEERTGAK